MKRTLAFVLSLVMVLSMFVNSVFAEGEIPTAGTEEIITAEIAEAGEEEKAEEKTEEKEEEEKEEEEKQPASEEEEILSWAENCCYIDSDRNGSFNGSEIAYPSVSDALAVAKPAEETEANPTIIRLTADLADYIMIPGDDSETTEINEERFIVLDLGDYCLSFDSENEEATTLIENYGTLTIQSTGTTVRYFTDGNADGAYETCTEEEPSDMTGVLTVTGGFITGILAEDLSDDISKNDAGAAIKNTGEVIFQSGTIIGYISTESGTIIDESGAEFTLCGGNIIGNFNGDTVSIYTGALFTMLSGNIAYNTCVNYMYGAGGIANVGTLVMSGGSIDHNIGTIIGSTGITCGGVMSIGGEIILGGSAKIENNSGLTGDNLVLTGAIGSGTRDYITLGDGETVPEPGENMHVGVSILNAQYNEGILITPEAGQLTLNGSSGDMAYFFSDLPQYEVKFVAGDEELDETDPLYNDHLELDLKKDYKWYYENQASDEYVISNTAELEALADIVNSGIDDFYDHGPDGKSGTEDDVRKQIRLSDTFCDTTPLRTPIGVAYYPFGGDFDGKGKNIVLDISIESGAEVFTAGLFGNTGLNTLKNISVSGSLKVKGLSGNKYIAAGGIAGNAAAVSCLNCSSSVDIDVTASAINEFSLAGGLVGGGLEGGYVRLRNCFSCADVTFVADSGENAVSETVGFVFEGYISNCYAAGRLSVSGSGKNYTGALAGLAVGGVAETGYGYYAAGLSEYGVGAIIDGETIIPTTDDNKSVNCAGIYVMPEAQMKACTCETEAETETPVWVEIYMGEEGLGKISVVDALNIYIYQNEYSGMGDCTKWGVMNAGVNDGYPVFDIGGTIHLYNGKVYIDGEGEEDEFTVPGISYDENHGYYIFDNVNLPIADDNIMINGELGDTVTILFRGANQIGVKADTEALKSNMESEFYYGVAEYGIRTNNVNLTLIDDSEDGADSLVIYDLIGGIDLSGDSTLNIGTEAGQGFSGTLTIHDTGFIQPPQCCITGDTINIHSGDLYLNNESTFGIQADKLTIDGGTVHVRGGMAAILVSPKEGATDTDHGLYIADGMEVTGAGAFAEEYLEESDSEPDFSENSLSADTFAIKNQTGADAEEYVVIKTKAHSHTWSYTLSKTVSDNDTVTATCTEDCDYEGTDTGLTITAPADKTCDGKAKKASFGTAETFLGETLPEITYEFKAAAEDNYAIVTDLTKAGFYKASFSVGEDDSKKTAYVEYQIDPAPAGICTYTDTIKAGTDLVLVLGGKKAGTFTITGSSCRGYQLKDENGNYPAVSAGALTESSSVFTWKYDGGLYAEVKTTQKCCSGKGWYRGRTTTKTVTTRYYLGFDGEKLILSASKVCACISVTADKHTWTYLHNGDGKHEAVCTKCGHHEDPKAHDFTFDAENHKCICGLVDPTYGGVTDVTVKETSKTTTVTSRGGSSCGYRGRSVKVTTKKTTYTYTISTKQTNVTVKKIEYSLTKDGAKTKVNCQKFTYDTKLESFYIDVTDSKGNVTHWFYNGTETVELEGLGQPS